MPKGRSGAGIKVKPRRIEVAMPVGRNAMPMGRRAMPIGKKASGKGATLDARFTRLLELRGEASARQSSAREQLLAKKRGQKAATTEGVPRREGKARRGKSGLQGTQEGSDKRQKRRKRGTAVLGGTADSKRPTAAARSAAKPEAGA